MVWRSTLRHTAMNQRRRLEHIAGLKIQGRSSSKEETDHKRFEFVDWLIRLKYDSIILANPRTFSRFIWTLTLHTKNWMYGWMFRLQYTMYIYLLYRCLKRTGVADYTILWNLPYFRPCQAPVDGMHNVWLLKQCLKWVCNIGTLWYVDISRHLEKRMPSNNQQSLKGGNRKNGRVLATCTRKAP